MFATVKNMLKRNKLIRTLGIIVEGTKNPIPGYAFVEAATAAEITAAEPTFVLANTAFPNPAAPSQIAVKATAEGIAAYDAHLAEVAATPVLPASDAPKPTFMIQDAVPVPVIRHGGTRESVYPFDALQPGQSFFVPATETCPDPAKKLGSTVSSATKRYKEATPARRFVIRRRVLASDGENGARIWRTL